MGDDVSLAGLFGLLGLLLGCGGPQFDGTLYQGEGFAFRVPPVPAGWERIESENLGEFQIGLYLAQQVDPATAESAAAGW